MIIIKDLNFITILLICIFWTIDALKTLSILATPVHSKEHVTYKNSDNTIGSYPNHLTIRSNF